MSNKQVTENLSKAEDALNSLNELGETAFDICDGVIDNCKIHIDDSTLWDKVHKKEKEITDEFKKRKNDAVKKLSGKDPFYAWGDGMHFYLELRKWKSMEMLSFWTKVNKDEL